MMTRQPGACGFIQELLRKLARGAELSEAESKALELHRKECADCRMEGRLFDLLACESFPAGPAAAPDAAARASFRKSVVDCYLDGFHPAGTGSPRRAIRWSRVLIPAAVAALLLLLAGSVVFMKGLSRWGGPSETDPVVLLSSGHVEVDGVTRSAGSPLEEGSRVAVGDGFFVLSRERHYAVYVREHSAVTIGKESGGTRSLVLERGSIIAEVYGEAGKSRLEITAGEAVMVDSGTLFSVSKGQEGVVVRVYRGMVKVRKGGRAEHDIGAGKKLFVHDLSKGQVDITGKERNDDLDALTRGFYEGEFKKLCRVGIQSVPEGADVRIGGKFLGRTPLSALIVPGRRAIEVRMTGYRAAGGTYDLIEGGQLGGTFTLEEEIAAESDAQKAAAEGSTSCAPPAPKKIECGKPKAMQGPEKISASQLLKAARESRVLKDWDGAIAAYEKLLNLFPASSEAKVSTTSLGEIYLEKKNSPSRALGYFKKYIKENPEGDLVKEARFGMIACYRKLGKKDMEAQEIRKFMQAYPDDVYSKKLGERLKLLEGM